VKRRIIDVLAPAAIHELYGASEGGATRISPEEWLAHPGSVGKPWPGVDVRILDETGERLPAGEQGLIYMTPMGTWKFHYHNDAEKTSSAWRDDAFTVGDIGYLDDEGYLYITDRASDMVLWGGVNIAPREIEEVLHTHSDVVDCAVFGVPDERDGEHLKAVVEARTGATAEALAAHVRDRLADYKVPREWELVDQLPRDPSGKVLKRLLRAQ
jgi:long-chain acyl-CoA synthetase